jgi:hypothetical protein
MSTYTKVSFIGLLLSVLTGHAKSQGNLKKLLIGKKWFITEIASGDSTEKITCVQRPYMLFFKDSAELFNLDGSFYTSSYKLDKKTKTITFRPDGHQYKLRRISTKELHIEQLWGWGPPYSIYKMHSRK